jgi:hypothetical protein
MEDNTIDTEARLRNLETAYPEITTLYRDMDGKVNKIDGKFDKLIAILNGNGHPEEGVVYRLYKVEQAEKDCPINTIADDVQSIKNYMKTDEDRVAGAVAATSGAVVIKYGAISKLWKKIWPVISHQTAVLIYILLGGGGAMAWNWKSIIHALAAAILEAIKSGGGH